MSTCNHRSSSTSTHLGDFETAWSMVKDVSLGYSGNNLRLLFPTMVDGCVREPLLYYLERGVLLGVSVICGFLDSSYRFLHGSRNK